MMRWAVILILALGTAACESTHTYTFYEVVHSTSQLRVGDMVKIDTKEGLVVLGTVLRVNDQEVVLTHETAGRQRVPWSDVQSIQRMTKQKVIE